MLELRLPFGSFQLQLRVHRLFLELLRLFHQLNLVILDALDFLFKSVDLLADGLEFVIFTSLILLDFVLGDRIPARLSVQLETFPLNLNLSALLLYSIKGAAFGREKLLDPLPLEWNRLKFRFEHFDFS